ncbi:MAG: hypothetical protein GKR90_24470 [Pseudomonadales bacterium]|nr:hypothetical protein [Pseudomonadales bacterium]
MIGTEWDLDQGVIHHRCEGKITLGDITKALAGSVSHQNYEATSGSVWDMRTGDFDVTHEGVRESVPTLQKIASTGRSDRRIAWVVEYETHVKVMENIYHEYPWASVWKVCKSIPEAVRFVTSENST